jgi:DNA-binding response OmpR family regulator
MNGQAPPEKTAQRPRNTVLVVEGTSTIRVAVAEALRGSGFQVLEAASGSEAVALLSVDMSVDVVCLHMQMPGDPDSFTLARWVQENRPNVRLVWTSGRVPRRSEPYSNGSLSEPFNYEDLRNQIRCLLT